MAISAFWPSIIICTILLIPVAFSDEDVNITFSPFQARSFGFLTVFERTKPFILFTTKSGIQIMNDDRCVTDGRASILYPNEVEIRAMVVQYEDNYIAFIDSYRKSCVRNLFNNDWNVGIVTDLKLECQQTTVNNVAHYAISLVRRAIYALQTDGTVIILSIRDPPCDVGLSTMNEKYANAIAFHITGFKSDVMDSFFIVGNDSQIHILMTNMTETDTLVLPDEQILAIESNQNQLIFVASRLLTDQSLVVWQFNRSLSDPDPQRIYQSSPNTTNTIASMSATNRQIAILIKNEHAMTWVVIHSLEGNENFTYECSNTSELYRILLVDPKQSIEPKDICLEGTEACNQNTADCHKGESFRYDPLLVLYPGLIEYEIKFKAILIIILTGLVTFGMILYGFHCNNGIHSLMNME